MSENGIAKGFFLYKFPPPNKARTKKRSHCLYNTRVEQNLNEDVKLKTTREMIREMIDQGILTDVVETNDWFVLPRGDTVIYETARGEAAADLKGKQERLRNRGVQCYCLSSAGETTLFACRKREPLDAILSYLLGD